MDSPLGKLLEKDLEATRARTMEELGDFIKTASACFPKEKPLNKVKESFFLHFLPHFLEEVEDNNPVPWRHHWAAAAGGWYDAVEVVDDHSGEVLFIVPPLLNRNDMTREIGESIPQMSDVMKGIHDARRNSPHIGRMREMADLNAVAKLVEQNSLDPQRNLAIRQYAVIVNRYRPDGKASGGTTATPKNEALSLDDMFG